jgi:3-dehydroquinate synthase
LEKVTAIAIRGGDHSYDAVVGPQLFAQIDELLSSELRSRNFALICDANTRPFAEVIARSVSGATHLEGDALSSPHGWHVAAAAMTEHRPPASSFGVATILCVPPGEQSKSLEQVGAICEQMARAGLDRSSFVIAVGGGVIGDLSGFVAAVFHRGIPHVQVPTTLLAMVDSSIGGKTGVNTAVGKNLVGTIHHPSLVIADVDTLKTLPKREFNQGLAEIIKHGIIADAQMLEELRHFDFANIEEMIARNIRIKAAVVAADERELSGERAVLNFGHTVGHAIERAAGYGELLHGEAISLGMVAACHISTTRAGLAESKRDKVVALLKSFELPTELPPQISREKILEAVAFDKKFARGSVRFVVTPQLGQAYLSSEVTREDIREAIAHL